MTTQREQVLTIYEGLIECARGIRLRGQEVIPMGFLLIREGDSFGIIQMPLAHLPSKDMAAQAMRMVAAKVGASYAVHITEAWSVGVCDEASYEDCVAAAAWINAGNELKDFPGAVEVLTASLDGPDVNRMTTIPIGADGSLGEPRVADGPAEGRFTNLSGRVGDN